MTNALSSPKQNFALVIAWGVRVVSPDGASGIVIANYFANVPYMYGNKIN